MMRKEPDGPARDALATKLAGIEAELNPAHPTDPGRGGWRLGNEE